MLFPTVIQDDGRNCDHDDQFSDFEAAILKSSILIVDDQVAHVELLERLLRDTGYVNVSSTLDPLTVGELHREHRYDLILLDLQMPGLDGFGVMEALKADAGNSHLPLIVLTAQPAHRLRALRAGARDFINKPFELVEVQIRIHHMLEVRMLHKELEAHNRDLERKVQERTAELQESEARYLSLAELAIDWYWEQNDKGEFTKVSGPVRELLGIADAAPVAEDGATGSDIEVAGGSNEDSEGDRVHRGADNWDAAERQILKDNIAAHRPFLDLLVHRRRADGSLQEFRISGQPIFDRTCRFVGYRGLGVEVRADR
jgi:DNA-binding response OmpR family regulator